MKRLCAVLLLFFTGAFCDTFSQSPQFCEKHLQIDEATREKWNPGIVKKNSDQAGGIVYTVKIKIKKSGYVSFEKLIIDGQALDLEVNHNGNRNDQGPFKKGDELTLLARSDKKKEIVKADEAVVKGLAEKGAAAAILYQRKNKQYYHTLSAFSPSESAPLIR